MGKSILATLVAFLLSVVPVTGGATTTYDTSTASITCNTLIGTVSAKPMLTETSQPDTVLKIRAALGGCTVSGADPALRVLSGKLSAKLTVTSGASCASLAGGFSVAGNIVFRWKTARGQELDFSATTFTPDSSGLVSALVPIGASVYGSFTAAGTLVPGSAFAGATPALLVISAEDILNMLGQCCTDPTSCSPVGTGIKKLHFGIGQITM